MLNIVCALQVEAKPLVDHFGLRGINQSGIRFYENESMRLICSGSGKVNSAAAVASLYALNQFRQNDIWLNIGIAGHHESSLGEVLLVDTLMEAGSTKTQYPYLPSPHGLTTSACVCVDVPMADYTYPGLVDMESWGFYQIASRYTAAELVQIIKVVSDNPQQVLPEKFEPSHIAALIAGQQDAIDKLIGILLQLQKPLLDKPIDLGRVLGATRFTHAQGLQLKQQLQQLQVLAGSEVVEDFCQRRFSSADHCLADLQQDIACLMSAYRYD